MAALRTRYVPLRNAAESPYRYVIDPQEQLKVWMELEDAGEVPWGIVHSHVASPAVPSVTDIGLAFFPDSLYLVCSLMEEMPTVRAWSIRDGQVTEVQLAVTEDGNDEAAILVLPVDAGQHAGDRGAGELHIWTLDTRLHLDVLR